jgi:hypothetical protein
MAERNLDVSERVIVLSKVGGSTAYVSTTTDWDYITLKRPVSVLSWQVSIVACGSASLNSCGVRLLGGIDGGNWVSLGCIRVSDTANSGFSTFSTINLGNLINTLKISCSTVSYGAGTGQTSLALINAIAITPV